MPADFMSDTEPVSVVDTGSLHSSDDDSFVLPSFTYEVPDDAYTPAPWENNTKQVPHDNHRADTANAAHAQPAIALQKTVRREDREKGEALVTLAAASAPAQRTTSSSNMPSSFHISEKDQQATQPQPQAKPQPKPTPQLDLLTQTHGARSSWTVFPVPSTPRAVAAGDSTYPCRLRRPRSACRRPFLCVSSAPTEPSTTTAPSAALPVTSTAACHEHPSSLVSAASCPSSSHPGPCPARHHSAAAQACSKAGHFARGHCGQPLPGFGVSHEHPCTCSSNELVFVPLLFRPSPSIGPPSGVAVPAAVVFRNPARARSLGQHAFLARTLPAFLA